MNEYTIVLTGILIPLLSYLIGYYRGRDSLGPCADEEYVYKFIEHMEHEIAYFKKKMDTE